MTRRACSRLCKSRANNVARAARGNGTAVLLVLLLFGGPAGAVEPSEMLKDPALEARARTISRELRCMVCQNEDIDTSQADFAHEMRMMIRERLAQGESDGQIVSYIRSRYGDFVLMQPPFSPRTAVLWLAPGIALCLGAAVVVTGWQRPRRKRRA